MRTVGPLAALALLGVGSTAMAAPVERFVEVAGPSGLLKGTLLSPATAATTTPVALIIPGSGPTDRDGNSPLGVKAAPYRLLAEALAERGIATARIDKRGLFASGGAGDPNAVTLADYAADVHAWAASLRRDTGAPCVWLLGHSEGALVALVAAQQPNDLCGLVLVSGMGRRLGEVLREQLRANPANTPILPDFERILTELETGRRIDASAIPPPLMPLFGPKVQGFVIDMLSRDAQALLKAYPGPALVVQGTSDLQISLADAERLAAARPGVKLSTIKGMNHVLKAAPLDRGANLATYADPSLPLAPGVADAVADFIKAHP